MAGKYLDGRGKGQWDYDFAYDILFFKVKDREYDHSIELENMLIDVDKDNFIVGMQILEASKFLRVPKKYLIDVKKWEFAAKLTDNKLEVRVAFQIMIRNKVIEKNPIILEKVETTLPNSEMICVPA